MAPRDLDGPVVRRLKVLLSAYACEPGKGSEPGVGWNLARELARHQDVWVLTRANNRSAIESELARRPVEGLRFAYYDLPTWARFWKRGQRGVHLYYYLWQLGAYFVAKHLHEQVRFDVAQHVTFVKYWAPSFLAFLSVPYVWGPVGGGESAPKAFWRTFGLRGIAYEAARETARWLGERDPLVRLTARRAALALATTEETAVRLRSLGVHCVELFSEAGLPDEELDRLAALPPPPQHPFRVVSIGRLLHLKGFHLSLEAFARAGLEDAEYWIVGDGPERARLEHLAHRLGVADRIVFWGWLPRVEVLRKLSECHVLVHPSLHDSGGWVCIEAMAAGRPVICLDLGGPGAQITDEAGIKIPARDPVQSVNSLVRAMRALAGDRERLVFLGRSARMRVRELFLWSGKSMVLSRTALELSQARASPSCGSECCEQPHTGSAVGRPHDLAHQSGESADGV